MVLNKIILNVVAFFIYRFFLIIFEYTFEYFKHMTFYYANKNTYTMYVTICVYLKEKRGLISLKIEKRKCMWEIGNIADKL